LTNRNAHTTFLLRDGTRVTFKALDTGLIEEVDIIKENAHVKGYDQVQVTLVYTLFL